MIQRRQNLYLFVLMLLSLILSFSSLPYAVITGNEPAIGIPVDKVMMNYNKSIPFIAGQPNVFDLNTAKVQYMLWCISLFALFALFSFKNLKRQITFCSFNFALIFFLPVFAYLEYKEYASLWKDPSFALLSGALIPLAFILLNILAVKGTVKDYNLLKSMDRIR